jgi:hypothetical protein
MIRVKLQVKRLPNFRSIYAIGIGITGHALSISVYFQRMPVYFQRMPVALKCLSIPKNATTSTSVIAIAEACYKKTAALLPRSGADY